MKVTLKDLPAVADAGDRLAVSGTAKGAQGDRVTVTVQRRYGAAAWRKVGTATTNKKGKYSLKVPLVQGGPTSFRVKVGGRTSKVESLAVYEWLNVLDVPLLAGGGTVAAGRTPRIGGTPFPRSLEYLSSSGGFFVKPNGLCTTFEVWTGFRDDERSGLAETARQTLGAVPFTSGGPDEGVQFETPVGPAVRRSVDVTDQRYLLVNAGTEALGDDNDASAVLGTPRLRCNAATLPDIDEAELPL